MSHYSPEVLQQAVSAVREGGMRLCEAEKMYKIPFTTLRRHVTGECFSSMPERKPRLGQQDKLDLKEAAKNMADMGFGLSRNELLQLASDICMESGVEPFKNGKPSLKWYRLFKKRQDLTLKRADNISANRQQMETREIKNEYFNKLKSLLDELIPKGLKPYMIYNLDETGLTLVTKAGKILCTKDTKIVRQRKSGERGENITVLATVNATGSHILPPTVIYRGHSINEELTKDAIEGTLCSFSTEFYRC